MEDVWRKCATCKKPIGFNSNYLVCSISTCNTKRAAMVFCDAKCWDAHLPIMRHREAFYSQKKSPSSYAEEQKFEERERQNKKNVSEAEAKASVTSVIIRKKTDKRV